MLSRLKKRIAYLKSAIALRKTPYNVDVLLHGSHVAIYPKLNICFNRIKKSGNTSISAFLEELSNNFEKEIDKGFKSSLVKPKNMKPSDLSSLSTYYSFVVVRDPFSRVLSGFLNKVAPGKSKKYSDFLGFGDPTAEGFMKFLTFLDKGGLHKNRHFWPQTELLYQPLDHFNHVAKLETLVNDMRIILAATGQDPEHAERLARPHKVEAGTAKITSASSKLEEYYTEPAVALVRKLYARDFELLGYPAFPGPLGR